MGRSITDDSSDLTLARQEIRLEIGSANPLRNKPAVRDAVTGIVSLALRPNSHFDARQTDRLRQQAQATVSPQMTRFAAGQTILRPGSGSRSAIWTPSLPWVCRTRVSMP
jgi:membrane-associated HD superfamily phosphohydrolase